MSLNGIPNHQAIPSADDLTMMFGYTNHRGEFAIRRATPIQIMYGASTWHPEPQWLLRAMDQDKHEERLFALAHCDFTVTSEVGTGTEVVAPTASAPLRDDIANDIFHTYIGVSASRTKSFKAADKVLETLVKFYEHEAAEAAPPEQAS